MINMRIASAISKKQFVSNERKIAPAGIGAKRFARFVLCALILGSILGSAITIGSAAADACKDSKRTIHYDVAAIDVAIPINGWGDVNPQGMIYALNNPQAIPNVGQIKDPDFKLYDTTDMTLPDKIQPLVLRANVGDCIDVTLTNLLETVNDRTVGMQVTGLPYDPNQSDGAFIGRNKDTTVAPGQSKTYRWYANRTGGFLLRDISNSQFPQDTINKGLFGMVIVEQANSVWFDSVTGRNFLKANPQIGYNLSDLQQQGTDPLTGKPAYLGVGASIFASVHQQAGALLPGGTLLWENVSGNDYRSYALIMTDEMEGIVGPIAWNEDGSTAAYGKPFFPATGLKDETFLLNYRSEPLRNREGAWDRHRGDIPVPVVIINGIKVQGGTINGSDPNNTFVNQTLGFPYVTYRLPNGKNITVNASNMTVVLPNGREFLPQDDFCNGGTFKSDNANESTGPDYRFYSCQGEESHLQSWPFGDPAAALPRAYWGDPLVVYAATSGAHETHTFHQHTHRWFHDPDQANLSRLPLPENPLQISNRLDVQGISPGEVFKLVYEQGAGSQLGTAGDSILHCHLYPHFAGGLWSAFRIFDKLRINFTDSADIHATLDDGTPLYYPDGTQEAALVPLPARMALFDTRVPGAVDNRAPAPRGMPNRTATPPNATHPGYPDFIAGKFGLKALQPPMFIINPTTGAPIGDRATPTKLEVSASYDGLSPGVTLVDPCAGPNREFGTPDRPPDRIYEPVAIQVPFIQNGKGGFFNPEQRAYVEKEQVDAVRKDPGRLKPYSWRANVGDCVEFHATNALQPDDNTPTLGVNDGIFHGATNTPEISNHIHIIRFDQLGSDGTSVNWNYDISQRIGETAGYRIFVDINGRTVFNHDHQFPTSHQQGGVYAGFIIEPVNSSYFKPDGTPLGPKTANLVTYESTSKRYTIDQMKGVGVAANILVGNVSFDKNGGISGGNISGFREFAVFYSDFTPSFVADPAALKTAFNTLRTNPASKAPFDPAFRQKPYNPPFDPDDYGADQGTTTLNYRIEPFQARMNISSVNATMREPAYVFSSRVWGDPETEVFRAYAGDPVVIRLMDGAHEEHHTFELHGHRWLHQPSDPDSFLTDNQASNIGEWFNYELQGNTKRILSLLGQFRNRSSMVVANLPGDYLFGSSPTSDLWNGDWGIFRVENGLSPTLKVLPDRPQPQVLPALGLLSKIVNPSQSIPKVTAILTAANIPCVNATGAKFYDIVAMQNPIVYNSVYGENDPFGLMYALAADEQALKTGAKKPEPLVLRANKGDCVTVRLTNHLPNLTALAAGRNVTFPNGTYSPTSLDPNTLQHFGDAQMDSIVTGLPIGGTKIGEPVPNPTFVFVKWPMSRRVSLHPHLVSEVAAVGDGATVGFMRDQTVGPGERITYVWYADEELGATLLDDYGDLRSHRHHGLFAALVIEPPKSIYLDPKDPRVRTDPRNSTQIKSGTSAVIHNTTDDSQYREFVPLFMDGLNLRNRTNTINPDLIGMTFLEVNHQPCSPGTARCADVEDQGESGINYRTERLQNRVPLVLDPVTGLPSEELFNRNAFAAFSSTVFQDPQTPVFEAFAGDPVVFRPLVPVDLPRVRSIGIAGHSWRHEPNDPGTNFVNVEGSFGVGKSFNYYLIGGAGGEQAQPGDYLYNNRVNFPEDGVLPGGHWGLLRVHQAGATNANIAPLKKKADLPQSRP